MAATNWEMMDGTSSEDLLELPPDRFCNRVVAWMKARMKTTDFQAFEAALHRPPPGVEPTTGPWSPDEMAAAFQTLQREIGS